MFETKWHPMMKYIYQTSSNFSAGILLPTRDVAWIIRNAVPEERDLNFAEECEERLKIFWEEARLLGFPDGTSECGVRQLQRCWKQCKMMPVLPGMHFWSSILARVGPMQWIGHSRFAANKIFVALSCESFSFRSILVPRYCFLASLVRPGALCWETCTSHGQTMKACSRCLNFASFGNFEAKEAKCETRKGLRSESAKVSTSARSPGRSWLSVFDNPTFKSLRCGSTDNW